VNKEIKIKIIKYVFLLFIIFNIKIISLKKFIVKGAEIIVALNKNHQSKKTEEKDCILLLIKIFREPDRS